MTWIFRPPILLHSTLAPSGELDRWKTPSKVLRAVAIFFRRTPRWRNTTEVLVENDLVIPGKSSGEPEKLGSFNDDFDLASTLAISGVRAEVDETDTAFAEISRGGLGDVYKGSYQNKPVAIKRVRHSNSAPLDGKQHATRDRAPFLRHTHPNVAELLGISFYVIKLPRMLYLVFPWYGEGTLKDALEKTPSDETLERWVAELARGLEYLHTRPIPIVHGHIRASNVLMDDGRVRLADCGGFMSPDMSASMTETAAMFTRLRWGAPEFVKDPTRPVTRTLATDVWALGCTIREMYKGKAPYSRLWVEGGNHSANGRNLVNALTKGKKPGLRRPETPVSPSTMPKEIWKLVNRCWARKPENRPNMCSIRKNVELLFSRASSEEVSR